MPATDSELDTVTSKSVTAVRVRGASGPIRGPDGPARTGKLCSTYPASGMAAARAQRRWPGSGGGGARRANTVCFKSAALTAATNAVAVTMISGCAGGGARSSSTTWPAAGPSCCDGRGGCACNSASPTDFGGGGARSAGTRRPGRPRALPPLPRPRRPRPRAVRAGSEPGQTFRRRPRGGVGAPLAVRGGRARDRHDLSTRAHLCPVRARPGSARVGRESRRSIGNGRASGLLIGIWE
jgi:hypothetical protein